MVLIDRSPSTVRAKWNTLEWLPQGIWKGTYAMHYEIGPFQI